MDTKKTEIYTPKYEGKRFQEHRLPLDLLEELSILREMTIEMAKKIYFEKNTDRKRIPRNFTDSISIELAQLEPGSTKAKILLVSAFSGLFPITNNHEYFEEAPKRIVNAIAAAQSGNPENYNLPNEILVYFERFGKQLKDDEQINFAQDSAKPIIFNKAVRKKLLLASSKSKQYTDNFSLRGKIIALDKNKQIFEVRTFAGKIIRGSYQSNYLDELQEAFVNLENGQKVLLSGTGMFRSDDQIQSIQELESIVLLDEFDVPARLEELAQLQAGWLDGNLGNPLSNDGLKWLSDNFDRNFNVELLPLPAVFPTPDGHIQFEWSANEHEITLEVNLTSKEAAFYAIPLTSDKEITQTLDFATEDGWATLNKLIQKIHK